jgi:curved DNA-binding protein
MQARIEVDLETAHAGGSARIQVGERTLDLKIPAGVQAGQQIRLAGQAPGGGDLLLEVQFRAHPQYTVHGRDVTARVPLMPWQAALGATLTVPTLGGPVELKVPPGTASGRKLRLKGRGLGGAKAGDHFVLLEVQAPAPGTPAQTEAYQALARSFGAAEPEA